MLMVKRAGKGDGILERLSDIVNLRECWGSTDTNEGHSGTECVVRAWIRALVDLDNNGMKGSPSDSFYVFPADGTVLEQASWQDMAPLLATVDKSERTGGSYPLTALPMSPRSIAPPPVLTTGFPLQPFRSSGTTYVTLTNGTGNGQCLRRIFAANDSKISAWLQ